MSFCHMCGTETIPGSLFCRKCGTRLVLPSTPQPAPQPEPQQIPQPAPQPEPQQIPQPTYEPRPQQTQQPTYEPVPQPAWRQTPQPAPRPAIRSAYTASSAAGNPPNVNNHLQNFVDAQIKAYKKKRLIRTIIIIAAAIVLLAAAAVCLIEFGVLGGSADSIEDVETLKINPISAMVDDDGVAYIPLMNGEVLEIDDDVEEALITSDRETVGVLTQDGELYITDTSLSDKEEICDDASRIFYIRNSGLIYEDEDGDVHRYLFADGSDVNLGTIEELYHIALSPNVLNIVYASSDGYVCLLTEDSNDIKRLRKCNFRYDIDMYGVSDDGKTAVWSAYRNDTENIYIYNDGDIEYLKVEDAYSNMTIFNSSVDGNFMVITHYDSNTVFIRNQNGELHEVRFKNEMANSAIFTDMSDITVCSSSDISGMFIRVCNDDYILYDDVYWGSADGQFQKVLSAVKNFSTYNGTAFYIRSNGNLYTAEIREDGLYNEELIAKNVIESIEFHNGPYVYYITDYKESTETGTLYVYKVGGEIKKISEDVAGMCFEFSEELSVYCYAYPMLEAGMLFYYTDTERGSNNERYGTLMIYDYKEDKSTRIAYDVILFSTYSGVYNGDYPDSFVYEVYDDGDIDWGYYDGEDARIFAKNVH